MAITYKCVAIRNPAGPETVVVVQVAVGNHPPMTFEVPVQQASVGGQGAIDPHTFASRIVRALTHGTVASALVGVTDTE